MEYVIAGLYIVLIIILGCIVLFNIIYRKQVKRLEKAFSINMSPSLIRLRDIDVAVPIIIFLIALLVVFIRLLQ